MGQLYRRGDTWYADYFDRAGRRRRESTRTSDIKVARARLRDLELATTDRAAHETEDLDAALTYFLDVTHVGSPTGTVRCYRQKARHLSRLIGRLLLDSLTRENVERYIATRIAEGAHRHSVHKELVVLRGALASARARDRHHGRPREPHLLVQALLCGFAVLAPFTEERSTPRPIVLGMVAMLLLHALLANLERFGSHRTANARQAAAFMGTARMGWITRPFRTHSAPCSRWKSTCAPPESIRPCFI